jgi:ABC-type glutathione transport system ATPase component
MSVTRINIGSAIGREDPLLDVRSFTVRYRLNGRDSVSALQGINFAIERGESVGVLGESASGKTSLALALLGLLPRCAEIASGTVFFRGRDLTSLREASLRRARGAEIALVPQEPCVALNPVIGIGQQVTDVIHAHTSLDQRRARAVAEDALHEVGLRPVDRIYDAYPHQLSGGQCQRVVIAQALICKPALLIADEPTSSLDQITQSQILALLQSLQRKHGFALLLISHDPRVVEQMVSRIIVLREGRIVDQGSTEEMFTSSSHGYTQTLLSCAGNA